MAKKRTSGRTQAVLKYPGHLLDPEDLLNFVELPGFSRRWDGFGLTEKDLGCVQALIMVDPKGAPVIEGTDGLRKMRCGRRGTSGKSDGYRLCYVYFEAFGVVLLVLIYAKNEQDDIPAGHKRKIRALIARVQKLLESRPYRVGPKSEGADE